MRLLVLTLTFAGIAISTYAEESSKPQQADGWQTLFDGKTLDHWKSTQFGGEGDVYIEDGALVMDMGNPMTGVTWTGKELPKVNYEVEFEGRRVTGGDFFCALTFPVKDTHASLVLGGWGGTIVGISNINGFDASENETTDFYKFTKGEWYKIRLKVTDDNISAWIGDKHIADVDYAKKELDVRIEVELSKPFGLATYETQGQIRNLRLRTLKQ